MLLNRSSLRKILPTFLFYLGLSLLLYFVSDTSFIQQIRAPITALVRPAAIGMGNVRISITTLGDIVTTIPTSAKNEVEIERKYNELFGLTMQMEELRKENQALREQLTLPKKTTAKLVSGRLFVSPTNTTLLLDEPFQLPQNIVIVVGNNAIGIVGAQKGSATYEAVPITDPRFKAKASINQNGQAVGGIVEGQFTEHMKLSHVLSTATIAVDELVLLDDPQLIAADSYVIGKIDQVKQGETQVFKEASVKPLVAPDSGMRVFIEVPNK